ncbi:hypothetical protein BG004_005288 [Podila humilis]|nr:hypothetical protein BG004_005288 [Podila humilis]
MKNNTKNAMPTTQTHCNIATKYLALSWIALFLTAATTTTQATPIVNLPTSYPRRTIPHEEQQELLQWQQQLHESRDSNMHHPPQSAGRAQIKRIQATQDGSDSTIEPYPHPDLAQWYRFREQSRQSSPALLYQESQFLQIQPIQEARLAIPDLEGHAVLDDENDDAGNELLDTEFDGLLRPDADDEVEFTIEGLDFVEEDDEAVEDDEQLFREDYDLDWWSEQDEDGLV